MSNTVHGRLHTIPDIDAGRIADNPSVLGHYTPPDISAKRPWYFGGANQRMYLPQGALENVGAKGSYLCYGKLPKKSPYVRSDYVSGGRTITGGARTKTTVAREKCCGKLCDLGPQGWICSKTKIDKDECEEIKKECAARLRKREKKKRKRKGGYDTDDLFGDSETEGGKVHDPTGIINYWRHPNSNR